MATLFDEIATRRVHLELRPLWKLKLTDEEFEELRRFLQTGVKQGEPGWFHHYGRECALFFAEYWKRYFSEGSHSKRDVLDSLQDGLGDEYESEFYEAAKNGAERLKIEIFEDDRGGRRTFDSILYQGGLPMRLICQTEREGFQTWHNFAKRLVRGRVDIDDEELGLGRAATELRSVREFADQLVMGISTGNPELMPFHCRNKEHPWFKALMRLKESERKRSREENPFSIEWNMEIDPYNNRGRFLARVLVPSRLSPAFLERHPAENEAHTTACVMTDGVRSGTVEYQRGFARMSRDILIPLVNQDTAVAVEYEDQVVASGSLDSSRPHLFGNCVRNSHGRHQGVKTNRMLESDMCLYIPEGWRVGTQESFETMDCTFHDANAKIIFLRCGFKGEILIQNAEGDKLTFGGNRVISETQVIFKPRYADMVVSPLLCDATQLERCHILTETEDGLTRQSRNIEFQSHRKGDWSDKAPYGMIKARGRGMGTEVCEPIRLCNVGNDFRICVIEAGQDSCTIAIDWPHGRVMCLEDEACLDSASGSWKIAKPYLQDPKSVRFRLTVHDEPSRSFVLKLLAPFRQVEITDESGLPVAGKVYVPFCDYDKFSYSIFGYDSAKASVENDRYRISVKKNKLVLSAGNELTDCQQRAIYRHGSIATLFGSMGKMRQRLENNPGSVVSNNVRASLRVDGMAGGAIEFNIREFPFKLEYETENNKFILKDPDGRVRPFKHSLLAFRLHEPTAGPVVIKADEDGLLRLPAELVGENDLLVTGKVPGRVLPRLFNKTDTPFTTSQLREAIEQEIRNAKLGTAVWIDALDWFDTASKYGIHYSSLFQLTAISRHKETLAAFLFQCMLRCDGQVDAITDRLMQFSRDLQFKWFWLIPLFRQGTMHMLMPMIDIDLESFIRLIVPPELATLPKDILKEMALNMIVPKMTAFESFLEILVRRSFEDTQKHVQSTMMDAACGWIRNDGALKDVKLDDEWLQLPDYNVYSKVIVNELVPYQERYKTPNENWLLSRANAFVCHLNPEDNTDLFSMSSTARRSLCLAYDLEPDIFIREAHNAMVAKKLM